MPYFLEVRDPWWGHWARLLWSHDWRSLCFAGSASLEADGCCSSLFEKTSSVRIYSKIVRRFRNRKSIAMRHRPNCWWYIRIHRCWFFLHGHTILYRGHHTEISQYCDCEAPSKPWALQTAYNVLFHSPTHRVWMNTQCNTRVAPIFFCPGPLPYSRNTRNVPFLIAGVIEHFLEANITSQKI